MNLKKYLLPFILVSLMLSSCKNDAVLLPASEFQSAISSGDVQLIDVRSEGEFSSEHIENAINMNVNSDDFESQIETLDKNKQVYIYCLSGGRSSTAAKILKSKGFKEIYELDGGLLAWSKQNLPVKNTAPAKKTSTNTVVARFKESIANDTLTLVDFFAYWCGPCMRMKPSIEKLEKELKSDVEILSIDVDVEQRLAQQYQISAMPTLVLFKNNQEVNRVVGYQSEEQLRNLIAKYK